MTSATFPLIALPALSSSLKPEKRNAKTCAKHHLSASQVTQSLSEDNAQENIRQMRSKIRQYVILFQEHPRHKRNTVLYETIHKINKNETKGCIYLYQKAFYKARSLPILQETGDEKDIQIIHKLYRNRSSSKELNNVSQIGNIIIARQIH
jgi:multidrug efflux pump subunit AcrB